MKARQAAKIREIKRALVTAGICTINVQAIINRILAVPQLPPSLVRANILEYIEEKPPDKFIRSWVHGF
jgi:hypothetical protein